MHLDNQSAPAKRHPLRGEGTSPETGSLSFDVYRPQPLLIVISGPSGVGKDAVLKRLKARLIEFQFVITATSRARRASETHGVDYFFVSEEEFKRMIEQDELIEYAYVYDHYKGVPKSQIKAAFESGKDVFMRLDVQGAARVRALFPEAVLLFIIPSDVQEWYLRLTNRQTESPESLQVRIETARREMECLPQFDYLVINPEGKLEQTVDTILAIVRAEHHRVSHRRVQL